MLHYAIVFLVIALIAALFGFGGIAAGAVEIARDPVLRFRDHGRRRFRHQPGTQGLETETTPRFAGRRPCAHHQ